MPDSILHFVRDLFVSDAASLPRDAPEALAERSSEERLWVFMAVGDAPDPPPGAELLVETSYDDGALDMLETIGQLGTVWRLDVAFGDDVPVHLARPIARAARRLRPLHIEVRIGGGETDVS